jgi:RHS repeat-associated protein
MSRLALIKPEVAMKKALRYVISLALMLACTAVSASTVVYYHNDIAGSPVVATDASGQVLWRESYRPYGERLTNSAASTGNDVWFTSRRQDVDTGLVYMGARYYDPVIGRFMATDPAGFDEKNVHSFNRYAYANNNPYRYVDPDGHQALPLLTPPPSIANGGPSITPLGKPTQEQQVRALEGFSSSSSSGFSIPASVAADIANFVMGGVPALVEGKLGGLIFKAPEYKGGAVTESGFLDAALSWLGEKPTDKGDGRYISSDGMRQVRFGPHETEGKELHGHFEAYDKPGGKVVENTSVKIKPD